MIDGAHPLVMKRVCGRLAYEADTGALRIGGADEKFLSAGILDVLQRHLVDLKTETVSTPRKGDQ